MIGNGNAIYVKQLLAINKGYNMKKINGNKLRKKLQKLLPGSSFDKDNENQVIIYTGLEETKNGNYKELK